MMQSTDASPISTDAPRATLAPRPKPPVSVFNPDAKAVATWRTLADSAPGSRAAWDASHDRFQHHADKAFGASDDDDRWLPQIPGQRQPSSLSGSAA